MKHLILLLTLACVQCTVPAHAFEVRGNLIILTPQEVKNCADEGGCTVNSNAYEAQVAALVQAMRAELARRSQTCRREPST